MTEQKKDVPFVGANTDLREFTLRALLLGLVLAVVLGAANAYLGLKAGMTIAATYPAAVIGMAVLKMMKGSILEENITRTVGSIGESMAAGAIFTLPAFYISGIWDNETFNSVGSYITASLILVAGGSLGILFVALLRKVMVDDPSLPFPESVAASEIHKSGRSGAGGSKYLFSAMIAGALIKLAGDLKLFATEFTTIFKSAKASFAGGHSLQTGFPFGAPSVSPAYLGVGYIIGPRLAAMNFSGSLLAWGVMVPILLAMLGQNFVTSVAAPGIDPESASAWLGAANTIWMQVVRLIAIGGMLVAATYTLYKMRGSLGAGLKRSVKDLKKATQGTAETTRTEKDLKSSWILLGICIAAVLTFCITFFIFKTSILVAIVASTIMVILAFFFAAVSGYLVGIIGSSNNPISGLTLTALVVTALILVICGVNAENGGVAAVLGIAAIVCVAAAVAGEMFQDLKAGHILGGTPWKMECGDLIGVAVTGFVMFGVLILLNLGDIKSGGTGFGGVNLPAPQAGLMATISKGIIGGQMAWALIITGMLMAVCFIFMGVKSSMLVFVGMYLPLSTVFAIFVGGLIKGILDMIISRRKMNEEQQGKVGNTGILMASGFIAGEALMGLVIAIFAVFNIFVGKLLGITFTPSYLIGFAIMLIVGFTMIKVPIGSLKKK
ncbi:MAG: oligopeptide transporter, OPT family [Bacteroidales bacterium]|jgi:putative OPT family oligopeptide transporter|nr:oligopeptide transporter, OPT family [Bacteroidales bacterium]